MAEQDENVDPDYDPQAELHVVGNWKKVQLPEIPVVTGEQDDQVVAKFRSKIYRFRKGEWKQRGVGELKLLKSKTTNKIRLLMRADKTHKIVANHLLQRQGPLCNLQVLQTSNNSWTWNSYDISDDSPSTQKFCAKFTSKEDFQKFKVEFDNACAANLLLSSGKEEAAKKQKKEEQATKKVQQPQKVEKKE